MIKAEQHLSCIYGFLGLLTPYPLSLFYPVFGPVITKVSCLNIWAFLFVTSYNKKILFCLINYKKLRLLYNCLVISIKSSTFPIIHIGWFNFTILFHLFFVIYHQFHFMSLLLMAIDTWEYVSFEVRISLICVSLYSMAWSFDHITYQNDD